MEKNLSSDPKKPMIDPILEEVAEEAEVVEVVTEEAPEEGQETTNVEEEAVAEVVPNMITRREMGNNHRDKTRENLSMRIHGNGDIEMRKGQCMRS
jgi:hypothetical protein